MEIPSLSETVIREGATAESFRRGQEYYNDGSVLSIARRGNVVEAEVAGSQPEPYAVRVEFEDGGIVEALCDCPYDWGGWCKHIVAVLLFCLEQAGEIEERQPLDQLLAALDRDQLQTLLLDLAQEEPRLANLIEVRVAHLSAVSLSSAPVDTPEVHRTPVDPKPFAHRVRDALHSVDYGRGWSVYSSQITEAVGEVQRVLDRAWEFIRIGDGSNALAVLEAITGEYVAGWESLDDSYGEASGLFSELGPAWSEALLSADLTVEERQAWTEKLEAWQRELEDYGLDEVLDPALEAAEQGWDFPPLQRVLREGVTEIEEPQVEGAVWDEDLITARLNVLGRRGRHEEYLNLARAACRQMEYTVMLVQLGRVQESVDHGLRYLATAQEALTLAKALAERDAKERALEIAQRGLSLEGRKAGLAAWLRNLAAEMGRTDEALSAALVALYEEPSLAAYRKAQDLAGEGWPPVRDGALASLRLARSYYPEGQVDIFLHEGLIDDAIAAVNEGAAHELVERVADVAVGSRPDWVIRASRAQAESIMDGGKAQYYDAAARWLDKARQAYQIAGREEEWRTYLQELRTRHSRKHKLVPLLRALAA